MDPTFLKDKGVIQELPDDKGYEANVKVVFEKDIDGKLDLSKAKFSKAGNVESTDPKNADDMARKVVEEASVTPGSTPEHSLKDDGKFKLKGALALSDVIYTDLAFGTAYTTTDNLEKGKEITVSIISQTSGNQAAGGESDQIVKIVIDGGDNAFAKISDANSLFDNKETSDDKIIKGDLVQLTAGGGRRRVRRSAKRKSRRGGRRARRKSHKRRR